MKKVFFLIVIMLSANCFAAAQESNSNSLKEIDEKIKAVNKKLGDTPCTKTLLKCDDAAKAERQKLLDEYYELKNERDAVIADAQRQEMAKRSRPSIFGSAGADLVAEVVVVGGAALIFFLILILILRNLSGNNIGLRDSHGSATQANDEQFDVV